MKKPSTLAQQIEQAQRTIASWSESKKMGVKLQGSDIFLNRREQATQSIRNSQKNKR
jgi:hypothetical protein